MESATQQTSGGARFAAKQASRRALQRQRIHARVSHPIDQPGKIRDPLSHNESALGSTFNAARLLVIALVVHSVIIGVFVIANRLLGDSSMRQNERVSIRVIETPPPPVKEEEPKEVVEVDEPTPPAPDFAAAAPEPKEEVKPPPRRKPAPVPDTPEPPVPANTEPEPANPEPVRRVVGLGFESTTTGGSGPSFATGTTRMGKTETTAADPSKAQKRPVGDGRGNAAPQRAAAHIPTRDVEFIKPKRIGRAQPPYPPGLKAQDIEGDVKVTVDIDANGRVIRVRVAESSGRKGFDDAAIKAAKQARFVPAKRDNKAVPYTLSYSYRFRIDDD